MWLHRGMTIQKISPNPDDSLRTAIIASLDAYSNTASSDIRVGVQNGIAHLAGTVSSYQEWARAEELTQKVPGIRGVVNRIDAPGAPSPAREINLDLENT